MSASIFEVQSSFSIEDNATGVLKAIAEQFATVGSAADEVAEQLRSLSRVRFDALARSADRAAASIGAMAEAASGVGNAAQTAAASTEAAATANERFAESAQAAAAAQVELTEALQRQIVIPPPVYYGEPEPPTRAADGARGYLGRDPLTVDTWAYETPSDRPMLSYDEAGTPYAARPGAFPYAGEQLLLGRSSQYGPYGAPKEPLTGFAGEPGMHNPYNRPGTEGPPIPMGAAGAAAEDEIGIPARPIDANSVQSTEYVGGGGNRPPGGGAGDEGDETPRRAVAGRSGRHFNPLGLPEMAGEFTVFEAVKQASEIDSDIRVGRLNAGDQQGATDSNSAGYQGALATIRNAQIGTVGSEAELGSIYAHTRGEARGRFSDAEYNGVFRSVANFGEISNRAVGENLNDAALAGFRDVDLFNAKSPGEAQHVLSAVTNLAALSGSSAQKQSIVLQYAQRNAGVDAAHIDPLLEVLAPSQQGYGARSTVGTNFSAFELELMEASSHTGSRAQRFRADNQMRRLRAALAGTDELHEHDREHMTRGSGNRHLQGFEALGLIDAHGRRLDLDEHGQVDYIRQRDILQQARHRMGETQFMSVAINAAGQRGVSFAQSVGNETEQQNEQYHSAIAGGPSIDQRQAMGQAAAGQTFATTLAAAKTALADIASPVLPDLKLAATGLTAAFRGISEIAKAHPEATARAAEAGAAVAGASVIGAVVGGVRSKAAGGSLLEGALHGAAWAPRTLVGGAARLFEWGNPVSAVATGVYEGFTAGSVPLAADHAPNFDPANYRHLAAPTKPVLPNNLLRLDNPANQPHDTSGHGNVGTGLTIASPTFNLNANVTAGVIPAMVQEVLRQLEPQLTSALNRSLMSSGGATGGSFSSPYTIGGQH